MTAPDVRTPGEVGTSNRALSEADSEIFGDTLAVDKIRSTVAARLALKGYALHELACGGYVIASAAGTRYAPDLRAAEAFCEAVQ